MKLRFPGFKILDRYILGKFLMTYFFAIAMIIVIVVVFDYVEKVDDFTELHAPFKEIIFEYYLNFIPFFINQFSGLFTFIACIFFTSKMAYQTEIVAMLSGGMSFRRLMWPYFLGALIIGSLSLTLNLWLIPLSQRHIVAFEQQYIKRKQNTKYNYHIYRQIEPGVFAYIRGYTDNSHQASFFALESYRGGTMTHSLEASEARFNPETRRWTAPRYIKRDFDSLGYVPQNAQVYPVEKNFTDGEIALDLLLARGCGVIEIYGGGGGREDHLFGNLQLCYAGFLRGARTVMRSNHCDVYCAEGKIYWRGMRGKTVSLAPVGRRAHIIESEGLKYPLSDLTLTAGSCRGISNVVEAEEASIVCDAGTLFVFEVRREAKW